MKKTFRLLGQLIRKHPFLFILAVSYFAMRALLVKGYFGASDDLHIAWLSQMHQTLLAGKIPPRYVPNLSYNFGYPLFNFVFPFPFYLGEAFHLLGFSLVGSVKAVFALSIPLSGYFMYKFVNQYTDKLLALSAGVLYIYTPYRSTDIYVRGAIGEIAAFAIIPLCFWAAYKITEKSKRGVRWIGIFSLSLALLITSHNIMAYMIFPFLFVYILLRVFSTQIRRTSLFINSIFAIILGLLMSLYFWLPAILGSSLVKYDTVFNYYDHFPTLRQLLQPYFGYGASVPGPYDGMSFFLGSVNIVLVVLASIYVLLNLRKWKREDILLIAWIFAALGAAVFMMNYRSAFLWDHLPLLPYFQFPWRFLSLATFTIPLFLIIFKDFKYRFVLSVLVIILAPLSTFTFFKPHDFLMRTDEYYLNRYVPVPVVSEEYKTISEEYLRLPKDTIMRPDSVPERVQTYGNEIKNIVYLNELDAEFTTVSADEITVNYNKYLFPGWHVLVDAAETSLEAGHPYGQITFKVPPGEHNVKVYYKDSGYTLAADYISLLAFVLGGTMIGAGIYKRRKYGKEI